MNVSLHFHEQPPSPVSAEAGGQTATWLAVALCLLVPAAMAGAWFGSLFLQEKRPAVLAPSADPRPEVQRFVEEAARGTVPVPTGELEWLAAMLSPEARQALPHEVNSLLARRGCGRRFIMDEQGHFAEVVPPSWPACLIDDVVETTRAGKPFDFSAVSANFHEREVAGDRRCAQDFLGKLNPRLAPLGKAATWDGRSLIIVTHP